MTFECEGCGRTIDDDGRSVVCRECVDKVASYDNVFGGLTSLLDAIERALADLKVGDDFHKGQALGRLRMASDPIRSSLPQWNPN